MTAPEPSAGLKALKYAEDQLGVNKVYADAIVAREKLDSILTELSEMRDNKRLLESQLQDAEMEVAADERGKHPNMSAAGMKDHLKVAFSQSSVIRQLKDQIGKVSSDVDGLECDRQIAEADIRIATSRMGELSGYLVYLAAIKNSIRHSSS